MDVEMMMMMYHDPYLLEINNPSLQCFILDGNLRILAL